MNKNRFWLYVFVIIIMFQTCAIGEGLHEIQDKCDVLISQQAAYMQKNNFEMGLSPELKNQPQGGLNGLAKNTRSD